MNSAHNQMPLDEQSSYLKKLDLETNDTNSTGYAMELP